jgi:hypothetical protein
MSFSALSTELDTKIVACLDHAALDAMSRVSKYYRAVTEPLLYQYLEFPATHEVQIKRLS